MGYYVNPKDKSKEDWLYENGERVDNSVPFAQFPPGFLPVVLIDNGAFTAAGIAFSENEYKVFLDPRDPRPRMIYSVSIPRLMTVTREDFQDYARRHFAEWI